MHRHGTADRLLAPDIDLAALDEQLDGGGLGAESARLAPANDFLGPQLFGRMFPQAPRFRPAPELLVELGAALAEANTGDPNEDPARDSTIPAGFTYFGQFLDHDITFDPTVGFPPVEDPEGLESRRTPSLDLDSVYSLGPAVNPELYEDPVDPAKARFKIGQTAPSGDPDTSFPNDLPRRPESTSAVISDPRNDENLVIAQLHLTFLKLHNKLIDTASSPTEGETPFETARRLVRWHYQWIVLNDFLPRIIDPAVLADIRTNGRKSYNFAQPPFNGTPFMPVEFSVAAYRMGHSMVRNAYNYNRVFANGGSITPATLDLLFTFTGASAR
ncbi:MAG: peroxidase family protein, partial [Mycobacteriales bacterium]